MFYNVIQLNSAIRMKHRSKFAALIGGSWPVVLEGRVELYGWIHINSHTVTVWVMYGLHVSTMWVTCGFYVSTMWITYMFHILVP